MRAAGALHSRGRVQGEEPYQPHDILKHQKRVGCYSLKYYQMIMHCLSHFIDDAGELAAARRHLAEALGEFEIVSEGE